jgi:hypothetical protein
MRIAYCPAPKICTCDMPVTRLSASLRLMYVEGGVKAVEKRRIEIRVTLSA